MTVIELMQLAAALEPFVVVTVDALTGALKGAGAQSDEQTDEDLRALVIEALAAKAEADSAAAGNDPPSVS